MSRTPVEWDTARDEATIEAAFNEATRVPEVHERLMESLDKKLVAIFGLATAIIGLAPRAGWSTSLTGAELGFWVVALLAWIVAVGTVCEAYGPMDWRVGPNPLQLTAPEWLHLTPTEYRFFRLRDLGKTYADNGAQVLWKAARLRRTMICTAVEVAALVFGFLLR